MSRPAIGSALIMSLLPGLGAFGQWVNIIPNKVRNRPPHTGTRLLTGLYLEKLASLGSCAPFKASAPLTWETQPRTGSSGALNLPPLMAAFAYGSPSFDMVRQCRFFGSLTRLEASLFDNRIKINYN